jgi:carboxypeptidase PM20D1
VIKRIPLGLLALLLLLLAAAVAAGTLAARSRQVTVAPLPVLAVDREAAGAALSAVVRAREARPIALAPHQDVVPVLPGRADAVVNFRILSGDTVQGVVEHVRRAVADERVRVEPVAVGGEASPVSSSTSEPYRHAERAIRDVFPGAVVAPGLMLAGDHLYRFTPVRAGPAELSRPHGTDERLSVDNFAEMIRFHHRLLQLAAGPPSEGKQP